MRLNIRNLVLVLTILHLPAYAQICDLGTLGGTNSYAYGVSAGGLVDVQNTYSALVTQGYQLNTQNTVLAINPNSDYTFCGANKVCISVGRRYTAVSDPTIPPKPRVIWP